ncbi:AAA family ATPase [Paenibacillus abyssi]|uniref:AAA domain-containing protein n=1 Tax=Paenibacillus abyssi TaxID=1340531 RepID=A0A917CUZ4_9BACL|nr:AAA family ATPase [Paenibacillus abyssi]GGG00535.1 hypothetical protein GCM10010916_17130 [Paenibacillus abyssi]
MPNDDKGQEERMKAKRGEMIAVCSAKGGSGRTVLAVNLAVALSKSNHQICIIDGDFQFGDVSMAMNLRPVFSVKDVVIESMDKLTLASFLTPHASGVKVLAAPDRPEYAELITPMVIERACNSLFTGHDYLIADTGVGLQESTVAFMEKADQVFLLTTLEMASIRHTKQMLETLELLGLRYKIQVIINRSTAESVIRAADVPDMLGEASPIYIPNDLQVVSESLDSGIPFVWNQGKTEIAKVIFKMAEQLITRRDIEMDKPKAPSILNKLIHSARRLHSLKG